MQKYIRSFTLLSAYLLLIACASQPSNGVTPATLSPQSLKRLGEFHWEQRHKINRAKKALEYFESANKYYPDDSELAALYSRACYFNGNYIETDPIVKDSLFIKGAVAAQSIILQDSTSAIAPEIIENSGSPWLVNVENISEELEKNTDVVIERLSAAFEPIIIILMAAIIGTIAYATILPILRISSGNI